MQIDVEAFFFLLMAVVVFFYYALRKGKKKRPTIAEEVSWEELTIEQALQQYNPAAAAAPIQVAPAAVAPPPVAETVPETPPPTPPAEPGYFTYEDAGVLPRRRKSQNRKRIAKKLPPDLSKPFAFNPRDAILYETIWKRKY